MFHDAIIGGGRTNCRSKLRYLSVTTCSERLSMKNVFSKNCGDLKKLDWGIFFIRFNEELSSKTKIWKNTRLVVLILVPSVLCVI